MAGMDKSCSLHDAIARDVENGMSVAMGCGLESLIPFAASHEIIRQKKTDLTLICPISDIQFDQLIGAGCVKKIIAAPRNRESRARSKSRSIPITPSGSACRPPPAGCLSCRRKRSKVATSAQARNSSA